MITSNFHIKNAKWKTFLFFLFIASLFWVLTKISKEFAAPITAKVQFINVPETASIKDTNAEELTFNLFTNGYEFLGHKLKKPVLNIDFSKYIIENKTSISIPSEQLLKEINVQFPSSSSANTLNIDMLILVVDPIVRKKVPVVVRNMATYKKGFKRIGSIAVKPDSIFVSGPQVNVKLIDSILTDVLVLELLDKNISEKIDVVVPDVPGISLSNKNVVVFWEVKEVAQKEFEIPLKLINKPNGETIKMIPNKVKIRVDVTLGNFNEIKASDFEVFCDYNERNIDENFMIAHLREHTNNVEHIEIATQKIDFLTFKQ